MAPFTPQTLIMNNLKLTALTDTFLKKQPAQSFDLHDSDKASVKAGRVYTANSLTDLATDAHSKVQLSHDAGEWYIYTPHWDISYVNELPTFQEINWSDMSARVSEYFTVGELLRYDRARIPTTHEAQANIFKLALELDKIREAWGSPIIVTSGYRPPSVNARVGGVRNSRHIFGDAADISPTYNLSGFQTWLDARWFGALGYGARKGFVHIDMRNNKGFNTGGAKGTRWNY